MILILNNMLVDLDYIVSITNDYLDEIRMVDTNGNDLSFDCDPSGKAKDEICTEVFEKIKEVYRKKYDSDITIAEITVKANEVTLEFLKDLD
jgi:hypothetical protein